MTNSHMSIQRLSSLIANADEVKSKKATNVALHYRTLFEMTDEIELCWAELAELRKQLTTSTMAAEPEKAEVSNADPT